MGWRRAARFGAGEVLTNYNQERPRPALGYATPAEVYLDPGAHGAPAGDLEAMRPEGHGRRRKDLKSDRLRR